MHKEKKNPRGLFYIEVEVKLKQSFYFTYEVRSLYMGSLFEFVIEIGCQPTGRYKFIYSAVQYFVRYSLTVQ